MEILSEVYMNNKVADYLVAISIIVLGTSLVKLFKKQFFLKIKSWSAKTVNTFDDFIVDIVDRLGIPAVNLMIIYFGLNYLTLRPKVHRVLDNLSIIIITYFLIRLFSSVIRALLLTYVKRQSHGEEKARQLSGLMVIINILVWTVGGLFLFDNMGYNVTALVTGLGIGGIAVALAAQNILGDLFNYFVIFLDRPFEVDDYVSVDDKMGTVEYIGIKTTRILSLTGEQLVFSNSDLTKSRIHNFKRMETRRIEFSLNVVYDISTEMLRQIPGILKDIVNSHSSVRFDRAHWVSYEGSGLKFVVVYFVLSSDYNTYMDIQQSMNLAIFEKFKELGIRFAFPTSMVQLQYAGEPAFQSPVQQQITN